MGRVSARTGREEVEMGMRLLGERDGSAEFGMCMRHGMEHVRWECDRYDQVSMLWTGRSP